MRMSSLFLAVALMALPAVAQDAVVRKSTGERLQRMTKMELQPFDAEAWKHLSGWTNGEPLTTEATDGRVVLVMTWAAWNPLAVRALSMVQGLHDRHEAGGLTIIGAHHPTGWEDGLKLAERRTLTFQIAHDADGEFRKALHAGQDPSFYVIDRSGQLRYADIVTESVERAVRELLAETSESAAGIRGRLAEEERRREEEFRRTRGIRDEIDLAALPEVPFMPPPKPSYDIAPWPQPPRDDQNRGWQGQEPEAPMLAIPKDGFHPAAPATEGRAVVVYFWHPNFRDSYAVMGDMDRLQRRLGRNLVVVGALVPIQDRSGGFRQQDTANDPALLTARMAQFSSARKLDHALVLDIAGMSLASLPSTRMGFGGSGANIPTPYAVLASSDGVVRYWGDPMSPDFRAALDRVIMADPGIAARRKAEEAYIRSQNR